MAVPFFKEPKQASAADTVNIAHSGDGTSLSLMRETSSATRATPQASWSKIIWSSVGVTRVRGNDEMIEVFYNMFDDQRHSRLILARRMDYNSLQFGAKCFRPKMAHTCRRRENKILGHANGFRVIIPLFFTRFISSGLRTLTNRPQLARFSAGKSVYLGMKKCFV